MSETQQQRILTTEGDTSLLDFSSNYSLPVTENTTGQDKPSEWYSYALKDIKSLQEFINGFRETIRQIRAGLETIKQGLQVIQSIIKIAKNLLLAFQDAIKLLYTALKQLLTTIKDAFVQLIRDLFSVGMYVYPHFAYYNWKGVVESAVFDPYDTLRANRSLAGYVYAPVPDLTNPSVIRYRKIYRPGKRFFDFKQFKKDIEDATYNKRDRNRPRFSSGTKVSGAIIALPFDDVFELLYASMAVFALINPKLADSVRDTVYEAFKLSPPDADFRNKAKVFLQNTASISITPKTDSVTTDSQGLFDITFQSIDASAGYLTVLEEKKLFTNANDIFTAYRGNFVKYNISIAVENFKISAQMFFGGTQRYSEDITILSSGESNKKYEFYCPLEAEPIDKFINFSSSATSILPKNQFLGVFLNEFMIPNSLSLKHQDWYASQDGIVYVWDSFFNGFVRQGSINILKLTFSNNPRKNPIIKYFAIFRSKAINENVQSFVYNYKDDSSLVSTISLDLGNLSSSNLAASALVSIDTLKQRMLLPSLFSENSSYDTSRFNSVLYSGYLTDSNFFKLGLNASLQVAMDEIFIVKNHQLIKRQPLSAVYSTNYKFNDSFPVGNVYYEIGSKGINNINPGTTDASVWEVTTDIWSKVSKFVLFNSNILNSSSIVVTSPNSVSLDDGISQANAAGNYAKGNPILDDKVPPVQYLFRGYKPAGYDVWITGDKFSSSSRESDHNSQTWELSRSFDLSDGNYNFSIYLMNGQDKSKDFQTFQVNVSEQYIDDSKLKDSRWVTVSLNQILNLADPLDSILTSLISAIPVPPDFTDLIEKYSRLIDKYLQKLNNAIKLLQDLVLMLAKVLDIFDLGVYVLVIEDAFGIDGFIKRMKRVPAMHEVDKRFVTGFVLLAPSAYAMNLPGGFSTNIDGIEVNQSSDINWQSTGFNTLLEFLFSSVPMSAYPDEQPQINNSIQSDIDAIRKINKSFGTSSVSAYEEAKSNIQSYADNITKTLIEFEKAR